MGGLLPQLALHSKCCSRLHNDSISQPVGCIKYNYRFFSARIFKIPMQVRETGLTQRFVSARVANQK